MINSVTPSPCSALVRLTTMLDLDYYAFPLTSNTNMGTASHQTREGEQCLPFKTINLQLLKQQKRGFMDFKK